MPDESRFVGSKDYSEHFSEGEILESIEDVWCKKYGKAIS
jgi:hypothetical protein